MEGAVTDTGDHGVSVQDNVERRGRKGRKEERWIFSAVFAAFVFFGGRRSDGGGASLFFSSCLRDCVFVFVED
jgi:hypothetical protein